MLKKIWQSLELWFAQSWYQDNILFWFFWPLLYPLSKCYELIVHFRYQKAKKNLKPGVFRAPIIVVGNITVGGSGKTPAVMALFYFLKEKGFNPGIVTRGYKGNPPQYPYLVDSGSRASESGDEALLLFKELNCPVIVDPDRLEAVNFLLAHYPEVNVVICDDGLQHYRLPRDYEIAIVDAKREFGNGFSLPLGPLREPVSRLKEVDMVLYQGKQETNLAGFELKPELLINVSDPKQTVAVERLLNMPVHAVAGISDPQRFFDTLTSLGLQVLPHPLPDHAWLTQDDLVYNDNYPVIMTAKDAVKCDHINGENIWYLKVKPVLNEEARQQLTQLFKEI